MLAVERDRVDAALLLESVASVEVDRGLVRREDHEDVGVPGSKPRVVLAQQCAPDPGAFLVGVDLDAVQLGLWPDCRSAGSGRALRLALRHA